MSYKNTILHRPGEKYPFLLATEADGIPLTRAELETLKFEIDVALMEDDDYQKEEYEAEQEAMEPHKRDGYAERLNSPDCAAFCAGPVE